MSHTVMTASQPGPGVHVRRAGPRDAAVLAAFGARVFAETFGSLNRPEDMAAHLARTYSPDRQARELADSSLTYFLAEASGALAGYALLRAGPAPACVATPHPIEILRFYVDRPFQGMGLARVLMDECVAEAARREATALWLGVWEHNPRAIRFYEKSGFRDVGSQRFTLGADVQTDLVMMRSV